MANGVEWKGGRVGLGVWPSWTIVFLNKNLNASHLLLLLLPPIHFQLFLNNNNNNKSFYAFLFFEKVLKWWIAYTNPSSGTFDTIEVLLRLWRVVWLSCSWHCPHCLNNLWSKFTHSYLPVMRSFLVISKVHESLMSLRRLQERFGINSHQTLWKKIIIHISASASYYCKRLYQPRPEYTRKSSCLRILRSWLQRFQKTLAAASVQVHQKMFT